MYPIVCLCRVSVFQLSGAQDLEGQLISATQVGRMLLNMCILRRGTFTHVFYSVWAHRPLSLVDIRHSTQSVGMAGLPDQLYCASKVETVTSVLRLKKVTEHYAGEVKVQDSQVHPSV